jgi:hypothetical protein
MAEGTGTLKRLYFVQDYAQQAASLAESFYKKGREFVPNFVEPYFGQVEDYAAKNGAPYLTWAQDTGDKFLRSVDGQVRHERGRSPHNARSLTMQRNAAAGKFSNRICMQFDAFANGLGGALNYSRDLHGKNMSTFNAAKSQYFGIVESLVNSVKAKVDPTPYVQKAVDTGKVYGDMALYWADPDKVVDLGLEYYGKVTSFGPGTCNFPHSAPSFSSWSPAVRNLNALSALIMHQSMCSCKR